MSSVFHLRREAENLEHALRVVRDRLRGQLASLLAILGEDSELLRSSVRVTGAVVWMLPLVLIERSQDSTSDIRGAARRRLIRAAEREVRSLELRIARSRDELERRNLTERLYAARRRLARIKGGG